MTQPLGAGHRSSAYYSTPSTGGEPAKPESKSARVAAFNKVPSEATGPVKGLPLYVIRAGSPGALALRHAVLVHGKLRSLCEALRQDPTADAAPGFARLVGQLRGAQIEAFDLDAILRTLFHPTSGLSREQIRQGTEGICQALDGTAMKPDHRNAIFERGILACDAMPASSTPAAREMTLRVDDLVTTICTHATAPTQLTASAQALYHRIAKPDAQLGPHVTLSAWRQIFLLLHLHDAQLAPALATARQFFRNQASVSAEFVSTTFIPVADHININASEPGEAARWIHTAMRSIVLGTVWPDFGHLRHAATGFSMALMKAPGIVQALDALLGLGKGLTPPALHSLVQSVVQTVWSCLPETRREMLSGAFECLAAPTVREADALVFLSAVLVGARHLADIHMVATRVTDLAGHGSHTPEFMEKAGFVWRASWQGKRQEAQAHAALLAELPKASGKLGEALAGFKRGMGTPPKSDAKAKEMKSTAQVWKATADEPADGHWGPKRNG